MIERRRERERKVKGDIEREGEIRERDRGRERERGEVIERVKGAQSKSNPSPNAFPKLCDARV